MVEFEYLQSQQDNQGKGQFRFGISEEAPLIAWTHRESGDHTVFPDLLDFVSREVENDASIVEQVRKAREDRHLAQKSRRKIACDSCSDVGHSWGLDQRRNGTELFF